MKILLVNPNENRDMTERMLETAGKIPYVSAKIEGVNADSGIPVVKTPEDIIQASEAVYGTILENGEGYDAFVIACFSDPGLKKIRKECRKPVLGMGETCMLYAAMRGVKFAVVTGEKKMRGAMEDQIRKYGLQERCSGVISVDAGYIDTFLNKEEIYPLYLKAVKEFQKEHEIEVLCVGGAVFTDWKEKLEEDVDVPVMEGIEMAVKAAWDLISG